MICPRCYENFNELYFGAIQDDGSYICGDCHGHEFYLYEQSGEDVRG